MREERRALVEKASKSDWGLTVDWRRAKLDFERGSQRA